jgi:hypothetical protein
VTVTRLDRAALALAVARYRARDSRNAGRLDCMFADRSWEDAARFAAYGEQFAALRLKPWEEPPCCADPKGDGPASQLLRRMIKAKISRYHPDPIAALEEKSSLRVHAAPPLAAEL